MTTSYTNTIFLAFFLFCLFITSSSTRSFIREFTDDFNTTLQQEVGAGLIQNLNHEVYSRDDKVSTIIYGYSETGPSSYSIRIDSYSVLYNHNVTTYESRPFAFGGYYWKLILKMGNYWDTEFAAYAAIDSLTPIAPQQEVQAGITFYMYNNNWKKYLSVKDSNLRKFNASQTQFRIFSIPVAENYLNPTQGYIYKGDQCEFGVDVIVPPRYVKPKLKSEILSAKESLPNPKFAYGIQKYSSLTNESYESDVFSIGGRNWTLQVYPNGYGSAKGKAVTINLILSDDEDLSPYEKVFVEAILRVVNQRKRFFDYETKFPFWYSWGALVTGADNIPLSDLKDLSKGFIKNDVLKVEVEILAISSTKFNP